ncbi:MAG: glycosyltransferase family 2 protein [Cyclobacteriaceae bacterium]
MAPRFSIVIPTYNRAHLIEKTLRSVLAQEFDDFEVLVIDDGSTDQTEELFREVIDDRVKYFRKENGERGAARNFGAARSRGSYINFFDSDDYMLPNHLNEAALVIAANANPPWFHLAFNTRLPDGSMVSESNNFTQASAKSILFDNKLSCNGVFLRSDIAQQFRFSEDRTLSSSEDWELWIRLTCRFPLCFSNTITSSVIHHDQRSLKTISSTKIVARDELMIRLLSGDEVVQASYGRSFNRFRAERYSFFMLALSEEKKAGEVWKWALKSFSIYPPILLSKRFLASLRNTLR